MKKMTFILIVFALAMTANAQNENKTSMEQRIQHIEDKMALKELVDVFSNLADVKDIKNQVLLFTEDAVVESHSGDRVTRLQGREELFNAFTNYLNLFDVVYHINGQQVVDIKGDTATGVSYCQVVLVGTHEGKRTSNTSYVIYNDTYVKRDGKWYIAHRKSDFTHREIREIQ